MGGFKGDENGGWSEREKHGFWGEKKVIVLKKKEGEDAGGGACVALHHVSFKANLFFKKNKAISTKW